MAATTFSPEKPSPIKQVRQRRMSYQPPLDDTFDMDESTLSSSPHPTQNTRYQRNNQHNEHPSFPISSGEGSSTPLKSPLLDKTRKEDLLLSSDYNSVFKSRPKIAVSPPFTPAGGSPSMLPDLSLVPEMNETPKRVFSTEDMVDFAAEHASCR